MASSSSSAAAAADNIRWSTESYCNLHEIAEQFGDNLPQIIRVELDANSRRHLTGGFWNSARLSPSGFITQLPVTTNIVYVMAVYKVVQQDRVIAVDIENNRKLSLPVDCTEKFIARTKSWFKKRKTLSDILRKYTLPVSIDHKPSTRPTSAGKKQQDMGGVSNNGNTVSLGSLTIIEERKQQQHLAVYIVHNIVNKGYVVDSHPTYIDLDTPTASVHVAEGDSDNETLRQICENIGDDSISPAAHIFEISQPIAVVTTLTDIEQLDQQLSSPSDVVSDVMSADSGYNSHREEIHQGQGDVQPRQTVGIQNTKTRGSNSPKTAGHKRTPAAAATATAAAAAAAAKTTSAASTRQRQQQPQVTQTITANGNNQQSFQPAVPVSGANIELNTVHRDAAAAATKVTRSQQPSVTTTTAFQGKAVQSDAAVGNSLVVVNGGSVPAVNIHAPTANKLGRTIDGSAPDVNTAGGTTVNTSGQSVGGSVPALMTARQHVNGGEQVLATQQASSTNGAIANVSGKAPGVGEMELITSRQTISVTDGALTVDSRMDPAEMKSNVTGVKRIHPVGVAGHQLNVPQIIIGDEEEIQVSRHGIVTATDAMAAATDVSTSQDSVLRQHIASNRDANQRSTIIIPAPEEFNDTEKESLPRTESNNFTTNLPRPVSCVLAAPEEFNDLGNARNATINEVVEADVEFDTNVTDNMMTNPGKMNDVFIPPPVLDHFITGDDDADMMCNDLINSNSEDVEDDDIVHQHGQAVYINDVGEEEEEEEEEEEQEEEEEEEDVSVDVEDDVSMVNSESPDTMWTGAGLEEFNLSDMKRFSRSADELLCARPRVRVRSTVERMPSVEMEQYEQEMNGNQSDKWQQEQEEEDGQNYLTTASNYHAVATTAADERTNDVHNKRLTAHWMQREFLPMTVDTNNSLAPLTTHSHTDRQFKTDHHSSVKAEAIERPTIKQEMVELESLRRVTLEKNKIAKCAPSAITPATTVVLAKNLTSAPKTQELEQEANYYNGSIKDPTVKVPDTHQQQEITTSLSHITRQTLSSTITSTQHSEVKGSESFTTLRTASPSDISIVTKTSSHQHQAEPEALVHMKSTDVNSNYRPLETDRKWMTHRAAPEDGGNLNGNGSRTGPLKANHQIQGTRILVGDDTIVEPSHQPSAASVIQTPRLVTSPAPIIISPSSSRNGSDTLTSSTPVPLVVPTARPSQLSRTATRSSSAVMQLDSRSSASSTFPSTGIDHTADGRVVIKVEAPPFAVPLVASRLQSMATDGRQRPVHKVPRRGSDIHNIKPTCNKLTVGSRIVISTGDLTDKQQKQLSVGRKCFLDVVPVDTWSPGHRRHGSDVTVTNGNRQQSEQFSTYDSLDRSSAKHSRDQTAVLTVTRRDEYRPPLAGSKSGIVVRTVSGRQAISNLTNTVDRELEYEDRGCEVEDVEELLESDENRLILTRVKDEDFRNHIIEAMLQEQQQNSSSPPRRQEKSGEGWRSDSGNHHDSDGRKGKRYITSGRHRNNSHNVEGDLEEAEFIPENEAWRLRRVITVENSKQPSHINVDSRRSQPNNNRVPVHDVSDGRDELRTLPYNRSHQGANHNGSLMSPGDQSPHVDVLSRNPQQVPHRQELKHMQNDIPQVEQTKLPPGDVKSHQVIRQQIPNESLKWLHVGNSLNESVDSRTIKSQSFDKDELLKTGDVIDATTNSGAAKTNSSGNNQTAEVLPTASSSANHNNIQSLSSRTGIYRQQATSAPTITSTMSTTSTMLYRPTVKQHQRENPGGEDSSQVWWVMDTSNTSNQSPESDGYGESDDDENDDVDETEIDDNSLSQSAHASIRQLDEFLQQEEQAAEV